MSRVAVLAPHPDDEVLGCTSVLLEHDVIVVHITEGVPASIAGDEAVALRAARDRESRDACAELGVEVERFVTLDALDQEVWCRTAEVANALAELLPSLECDAVYAPAFQSGHPDHDGLYVAAQLARSELPESRIRWTCYALYALDDRGHPGYGWLHPGLFPDRHRSSLLSRGDGAGKSHVARSHPIARGSVVQSWLDAPVNERFAPMPRRDAPIPHLRSYYDEVFRFDEQGINRGTVDRVLRDALSTV